MTITTKVNMIVLVTCLEHTPIFERCVENLLGSTLTVPMGEEVILYAHIIEKKNIHF